MSTEIKATGRNLVQQRLPDVGGVGVEQRHIQLAVPGEAAGEIQSAGTPAADHDLGRSRELFAIGVHRRQLRLPSSAPAKRGGLPSDRRSPRRSLRSAAPVGPGTGSAVISASDGMDFSVSPDWTGSRRCCAARSGLRLDLHLRLGLGTLLLFLGVLIRFFSFDIDLAFGEFRELLVRRLLFLESLVQKFHRIFEL
jgi:hypothetical protein